MSITRIKSYGLADGAVTTEKISNNVSLGVKISNIEIANSAYSVLDDTAIALEGGYLVITGAGFASGCQVIVDSNTATSTTFVNSTTLRAQVGAAAAGSKVVYVVNTDGGTAIRVNGLTYSATPTWVTGSTLTEGLVDTAISIQLNATADSNVSYQLLAGSTLPAGLSLAANGLLTGTVTGIEEETTYSFTIEAIDAENQESPRTFSLTISVAILVDYLVVAGGGGGGASLGGGGAGGFRTDTGFSVAAGANYTVTVGGGGAGGASGSNSVFSTITSAGGGAGGTFSTTLQNGLNGGSGGGGSAGSSSPFPGGTGGSGNTPVTSPSQGNNGGNGANGGAAGGGGGGANAAGVNGTGSTGGNGGAGTISTISGISTTYAGGGGGAGNSIAGAGGAGGGAGGTFSGGGQTAGGTNTGGGGGAAYNSSGSAGGSGVVILKYPDTVTISNPGGGLTFTTSTAVAGYKITTFTAGTGNIQLN